VLVFSSKRSSTEHLHTKQLSGGATADTTLGAARAEEEGARLQAWMQPRRQAPMCVRSVKRHAAEAMVGEVAL
jgi:hypothetical protein